MILVPDDVCREEVLTLGERLVEAIGNELEVDDYLCHVGLSVGIRKLTALPIRPSLTRKFSSAGRKRAVLPRSNRTRSSMPATECGKVSLPPPTEPAKLTLEFTQEFGSQSADEVNGKTFMINGLTYEIYIGAEDNKPENGNIIINLTEWEDSPVGDQIASNINHLMEKLKEAIRR